MNKQFKIVHAIGENGVGGGCAGGTCPTIYETNKGSYAVQGKKLNALEKQSLGIPEDEDVVEIPIEFLKSFIS
jgi:hypothetical protein